MNIKSATFCVSSPNYRKCPDDGRPEYAFIGRSNVGKSSLINMLTGVKGLAKTSGRPGKTQLINHFLINNSGCGNADEDVCALHCLFKTALDHSSVGNLCNFFL